MKTDSLISSIVQKLDSFLKRHNLTLLSEKKEDWGFKLFFKNEVAGLLITFENKGLHLTFDIAELKQGKWPPVVDQIEKETKLYLFDLNDITSLFCREGTVSSYATESEDPVEDLEKRTDAYITNLERYTGEVFKGDFSLFKKVEEKVKFRACRAAFDLWGEDAKKFGWKKSDLTRCLEIQIKSPDKGTKKESNKIRIGEIGRVELAAKAGHTKAKRRLR